MLANPPATRCGRLLPLAALACGVLWPMVPVVVAYIVTRKLEGHQSALIDRFTSPRPSPLAERINRASYDALITTATD